MSRIYGVFIFCLIQHGIYCQEVQVNKEFLIDLIEEFREPGDSINLDIFFYEDDLWNGGNLTKLRTLAGYLNVAREYQILIENHTDCRGKVGYNQAISKYRAKEIRRKLISEGVNSQRIVSIGSGEEYPLVNCECKKCSEEEHLANRRTVIRLIAIKPEPDKPESGMKIDKIDLREPDQNNIYVEVCVNNQGRPVYVRINLEKSKLLDIAAKESALQAAKNWKFTEDSTEIQCGYLNFRFAEN